MVHNHDYDIKKVEERGAKASSPAPTVSPLARIISKLVLKLDTSLPVPRESNTSGKIVLIT